MTAPSNSAPAGGGAPPPTTRLMPYQHSLGLLSTLRIFRGENEDVKRVHVPLRLVVVYWELLCGLKKSTALLTLQALENDGSLSLTRYDAMGNPEYWEGSDAVEDLAAVLLEHGGIHSVIPRLVRVESADSSSGSDEDDAVVDDDAMLLMAGATLGSGNPSFSGVLGASMERPTIRMVNTASAELRKAKEEMEQIMNSVGGVTGSSNPTEIFMLPREAAAMAMHDGEAGSGGTAAASGAAPNAAPNIVAATTGTTSTHESPKPEKDLRTSAVAATPGGGAPVADGRGPETTTVAHQLTERVDALELEGVFIVLNQRQYTAAVAAHVNSGSVKSKVEFGLDATDSATGSVPAVASSPLRGVSSPLSQRQQQHVIFLSACDDEELHRTTVRAYRTMLRGREDNWAQGPQDHYYYQNVEYHVRRGEYQGPFELTLAWRLALLMNMQPEAFESVYGTATTPIADSAAHGQGAGPGSPTDADWRWSHGCQQAEVIASSFPVDDIGAVHDVAKPRVAAAGAGPTLTGASPQHQQPVNSRQQSPYATSISPPSTDDLIPFFMKRCPLVAMAASRAERSLLNANKRAAGGHSHHHPHGLSADYGARTSSLSTSTAGNRKSKLSLSPASSPPEGSAATPAHSPFRFHLDDGGASSQQLQRPSDVSLAIPIIGLNSPSASTGKYGNTAPAATPGLAVISSVTSPELVLSSGAFGSQGGGARFGAEPFQAMLDAALSAMPNFDAVVELMLRGEERVSAVATFVLEHCVDMTEGQVAVVKALCRCFFQLPDERVVAGSAERHDRTLVLHRGMSFLLATSAMHSEFAVERDPQAHVRCQDLVHAVVAYMDYVDHTLHWTTDATSHDGFGAASVVSQGQREHEAICSELRVLLLRGHQLFFPGPLAVSVLLDIVRTRRLLASQSGVLAYVGWLRTLHSIARCFRGSPLQQLECLPPSFAALEQAAARHSPSPGEYQRVAASVPSPTLTLLYEWSVSATSPALRWASSFMLHNRSPEEERSSFIEDVVYHYWVRHDTQEVRNGVVVLCSHDDGNNMVDLVQVMADFVAALPSSSVESEADRLALPWTGSEWRVLPPRLQKAIQLRRTDVAYGGT